MSKFQVIKKLGISFFLTNVKEGFSLIVSTAIIKRFATYTTYTIFLEPYYNGNVRLKNWLAYISGILFLQCIKNGEFQQICVLAWKVNIKDWNTHICIVEIIQCRLMNFSFEGSSSILDRMWFVLLCFQFAWC